MLEFAGAIGEIQIMANLSCVPRYHSSVSEIWGALGRVGLGKGEGRRGRGRGGRKKYVK
jgi:hypothetical protein